MNLKLNSVLTGVILILVALCIIFGSIFSIKSGYMLYGLGSLSFMLLYHTRRKTWALVVGIVLAAIACEKLFNTVPFIGTELKFAIFFLVPALIFGILYTQRASRSLLVFSCLFFWVGLFVLIGKVPFVNLIGTPLMFFALSLGNLSVFALSGTYFPKRRSSIYAAVLFMLIGLLGVAFDHGLLTIFGIFKTFLLIVLFTVGIILIINGLRNNKNK